MQLCCLSLTLGGPHATVPPQVLVLSAACIQRSVLELAARDGRWGDRSETVGLMNGDGYGDDGSDEGYGV